VRSAKIGDTSGFDRLACPHVPPGSAVNVGVNEEARTEIERSAARSDIMQCIKARAAKQHAITVCTRESETAAVSKIHRHATHTHKETWANKRDA
jgi:hypothetical protein